MVRYTGPKNRLARRFGVNIFGRTRNPLLHKPNPPGMHGARRRKKSDYGLQLEEKQKLKVIFGMITDKQLVNYYKESLRRQGNTVTNLLVMLESRLDTVVYRLGFASTIFAAHQLVSHGHVQVNGKKVDRRSFQVKPGMTVSIREKSRNMQPVRIARENPGRTIPDYLSSNLEASSGQMMALPEPHQIPLPLEINVPMICEFLAHST
jgi:small subunit ribosomal protein S4